MPEKGQQAGLVGKPEEVLAVCGQNWSKMVAGWVSGGVKRFPGSGDPPGLGILVQNVTIKGVGSRGPAAREGEP